MLKSDLLNGLARIELVSGGAIAGLITEAQAGAEKLKAALREIAGNTDASSKNAVLRLHEAIAPLNTRLVEISPSGTAIELHGTGGRFDRVLEDYPSLELLLRPGRQALAHLAGAYDVVLQERRRPQAVVSLIAPALELAICYEHYAALRHLFAEADHVEGEESASVTIAGAEQLDAFASYAELLSQLARTAAAIVSIAEGPLAASGTEIWIQSIESGSPIEINFRGNAKTLRFFLSMIRDAFRTPYLRWSTHGRLMQAMETLAEARKLGIDSPEALAKLEEAVVSAAAKFANSLSGQNIEVLVQGKPITTSPALPQISTDDSTRTTAPQLPPPKDS